MRKTGILLSALLLSALLLTACGTASATAQSEPQTGRETAGSKEEETEMEQAIYRGTVTEITGDRILVTQVLPGYNYGQESIAFHITGSTVIEAGGAEIAAGAFVEVAYNGILTRSLPPQGTAESISLVSSFSEGIVVNGIIQSVQKTDTGYTLQISSLSVEGEAAQSGAGQEVTAVLLVPADALEHLTEADLTAGTPVSAVTTGLAALSLPPQLPVRALLPYTQA